MDLSDGLSLDLHRLCAASGLRAQISAPPVYRGATLEQALHGGEDYELLFTAPARVRVPDEFEGLALTRIGTMRKGLAGAVEMDGAPLPPLGYDHLRTPYEPAESAAGTGTYRGLPALQNNVRRRVDGRLRRTARSAGFGRGPGGEVRRKRGRDGTAAGWLRGSRTAA